jgi:hypothetical protein
VSEALLHALGTLDHLDMARLLDAILVAVLLEAAVLRWWFARTGRGPAPREWLPTLCAGAALMLALRAALADAHPAWIGAALLGAGVAHALDLARRWPRGGGAPVKPPQAARR